jgi:hypothetical protein
VRTEGALAALESLRQELADLHSEVGKRRDAAYLRVFDRHNVTRWAVVSTPGDRWFSLEVDLGFSLDHFEEGTDDAEVQALLRRYVEGAAAYVNGGADELRTGRFGNRPLKIATTDGELVLRRSVLNTVKHFFRR